VLGRADEGDPGVGAGLGQVGVLREEAVTGVDRVGLGEPGGLDDPLDVEVGAHRMAGFPDLVGLVSLEAELGLPVLLGEHRHGAHSELGGGAEGADRDLPPIGHQDLGEHDNSYPARRGVPPRFPCSSRDPDPGASSGPVSGETT